METTAAKRSSEAAEKDRRRLTGVPARAPARRGTCELFRRRAVRLKTAFPPVFRSAAVNRRQQNGANFKGGELQCHSAGTRSTLRILHPVGVTPGAHPFGQGKPDLRPLPERLVKPQENSAG